MAEALIKEQNRSELQTHDTNTSIESKKQHQIKIDLPGILKLLGAQIYAEPDVAVREMIQNAHDSCIRRKAKDSSYSMPTISVSFDSEKKTLLFEDNGIGMTEGELHDSLSTIGYSLTRLEGKKLKDEGIRKELLLIGQFGIGLLSAFAVAKQVEIFTKSSKPLTQGKRWNCDGSIDYSMETFQISDPGTKVILYLNEESLVLLDEKRLKRIIKTYADFISIPIFMGGNQVNVCTPPWNGVSGSANLEAYIWERYNMPTLAVLPFHKNSPHLVDGLFFIPDMPSTITRSYGELDVYISRMFVKGEDKSLLPKWAGFIKGIINTTDLNPTLARDNYIRDDALEHIRSMLKDVVSDFLSQLKYQNPDQLEAIITKYNAIIKKSCLNDDTFFRRISDMMQVRTTKGQMSIGEYREKSGDVLLFYSEYGATTQYEYLLSHIDKPVIQADSGLEIKFIEKYAKHANIQCEKVETGSRHFFTVPDAMDKKWKDLEQEFKLVTDKDAKAVSFQPNHFPAIMTNKPKKKRVVSKNSEKDFEPSSLRKMLHQNTVSGTSANKDNEVVFNLNINSSLMEKLADSPRDKHFRLALAALCHNARLFAKQYITPDNAKDLYLTLNESVEEMVSAIQKTAELKKIRDENEKFKLKIKAMSSDNETIELFDEPSCFFAHPFRESKFHVLRKKISQILSDQYDIRLLSTSEVMLNQTVVDDIRHQIARSHFSIADITGNNPNVLWELGLMFGYQKPVIILKDKTCQEDIPFDVFGYSRVEYISDRDAIDGEWAFLHLEKGLKKNLAFISSKFDIFKKS